MKKTLSTIIVNDRYFIAGGPERYLFNIKRLLEKHSQTVIPLSVKHAKNVPTFYSKYFLSALHQNPSSIYFREIPKDPMTLIKLVDRTFYSFKAKRAVGNILKEYKIDIAYLLHFFRWISPSILDVFHNKNIPVIVRLSDYIYMCPGAYLLRDDEICELCIKGNYLHSVRYMCVQDSLFISFINALSIYFHKMINIMHKVDAFVCPSLFALNKMAEAGFKKDKLYHVPTFVDTDYFTPRYRVGNYILYFGRVSREKGVSILVEAFIKLKVNRKWAPHLMIVGKSNDNEIENLRKAIKSHNVSNIEFLEEQDQTALRSLIRNAAFVVVPSIWYENMPNTVLESYACGKPVIASNIGSFGEFVHDGTTGFLFKPGNVDDLADKIQWMIDHPENMKEMGKYARVLAEEKYNPELHYQRLMKVYKTVFMKHGKKIN